jgi:NADH-quinone oxidoreductase subunit A
MGGQIQQFVPVGILLVMGTLFAAACIFLPALLCKKRSYGRVKDQPYECGLPSTREESTRFSVKFYLVAMLFILFDLEVIFVVTWATQYKDLIRPAADGGIGAAGLWSMVLFLLILEIGHFYIWRKGALNWAPFRPGARAAANPAA